MLKKWLQLGQKAKNIVDLTSKNMKREEKLRVLEKVSAVFQSENILTYPYIKERVQNKTLEIRVWYYKIETGEIEEYCSKESEFKQIGL